MITAFENYEGTVIIDLSSETELESSVKALKKKFAFDEETNQIYMLNAQYQKVKHNFVHQSNVEPNVAKLT